MATITLKGISPKLHRALKQRAVRNRRSLNQEVLANLETTFETKQRNVEEILAEARKIRESMNFTATAEEIDAAKREGRE
jgi:plasmid stability protein